MGNGRRRRDDGAVRVVVFQEGAFLVAQCLEYDIAVQAPSFGELRPRFEKTMVAHMMLAIEHGDQPFEKLAPAPDLYWEMFEKAEKGGKFAARFELNYPERSMPSESRTPRSAEVALA